MIAIGIRFWLFKCAANVMQHSLRKIWPYVDAAWLRDVLRAAEHRFPLPGAQSEAQGEAEGVPFMSSNGGVAAEAA